MNLLCDTLAKRCRAQMQIEITFRPALKEHLVTKYSDAKMGARPLKRALQNVVENQLAEEILAGRVRAGDTVTVGFRREQVVFDVKEK